MEKGAFFSLHFTYQGFFLFLPIMLTLQTYQLCDKIETYQLCDHFWNLGTEAQVPM